MGLFCVNMHFQTTDDRALSAALDRRGVSRYQVLTAKGGWTSLYEDLASDQDDERIRDLTGGLSEELDVSAIAFMVHDSDVARYWLFDNGQLLDDYDSCPDYFRAGDAGDDEPRRPTGGRPRVLLRYCPTGVREDELAAALTEETLFAETIVERLADALGIDCRRALTDYRDVVRGDGAGGIAGSDDDGVGDDFGGAPQALSPRVGLASQLAKMLATDPPSASDPQTTALVQAAAGDDVDTIDRLVAAGVAIDAEAPTPLPGGPPAAGRPQFFPTGTPRIAATALLTAVVNGCHRVAERLLDHGADPNRVHPLFGTPLHAATGAGDVRLLELLIDHGGDVTARNAQGQTLLEVLAAGRAAQERVAQTQALMKAMGAKLPGLLAQVANITLPLEGWDACEGLLKARGAQ